MTDYDFDFNTQGDISNRNEHSAQKDGFNFMQPFEH
jgi:hypothetical protein